MNVHNPIFRSCIVFASAACGERTVRLTIQIKITADGELRLSSSLDRESALIGKLPGLNAVREWRASNSQIYDDWS